MHRVALVLLLVLVGCGGSEEEPVAVATTQDIHDPVYDCVDEITYKMDQLAFAETDSRRQQIYQQTMMEWGHTDPKYQALVDLTGEYILRSYQVGLDQAVEETYPMVVAKCEDIVN